MGSGTGAGVGQVQGSLYPMFVESELSSLQSLEGDSAVWLVYEM